MSPRQNFVAATKLAKAMLSHRKNHKDYGEKTLQKKTLISLVAELGNCEEELPKKPVGRLSVNCRPTVGRLSADSWPTVGQLSTDKRPTVGQLFGELFFTITQSWSDPRCLKAKKKWRNDGIICVVRRYVTSKSIPLVTSNWNEIILCAPNRRPVSGIGFASSTHGATCRLVCPGVLADLDPPRIGPPGPNPLADMDPPVHIR